MLQFSMEIKLYPASTVICRFAKDEEQRPGLFTLRYRGTVRRAFCLPPSSGSFFFIVLDKCVLGESLDMGWVFCYSNWW